MAVTLTGAARRTRRWKRLLWLIPPLLIVGAALGLWFGLPVRTVNVSGNRVLTAERVRELAGLTAPFGPRGGWLYYGGWRAAGLKRHPWVLGASVLKQFPGTVSVHVTERVPAARWQRPDGTLVEVAWDGTVLPGAPPGGPLLSGWGPERLADARSAAQALSRYNVESVAYTPSGITVRTAQGTVWSGDMSSYLKYAGGITMFPGKQINIYPWGVSVQQ